LDCTAPGVFCQEILTLTQPTTLKPTDLNALHFGRDHLSVLAQHDLWPRIAACCLGRFSHRSCRLKPSCRHAGAQGVKPESLSIRNLNSCGQSSRAQVISDKDSCAHRDIPVHLERGEDPIRVLRIRGVTTPWTNRVQVHDSLPRDLL